MYVQQRERTAAVPSRRQEGTDTQGGGGFPRSMENSLAGAGRQSEGPGPERFTTVVVQPVRSFLHETRMGKELCSWR